MLLSAKGVRLADLTRTSEVPTLDTGPSWSPDGRTVLFTRARGQSLEAPRIYTVAAEPGSVPRPLLPDGPGRHRDARWAPDGNSIVFADDREGTYDLYRLGIERDSSGTIRPRGSPVRITDGSGQELSPSVSPDGKTVVFMEISANDESSRLRSVAFAGGVARSMTSGPLDVTPAFNPEKPTQVAFAARADGRDDMDLFVLDIETGERSPIASEPIADLTGPVWSVDGRHLFATAVFRSVKSGEPILSSIVVLDTFASEGVWRALHDPAFTESRIGVAVAPRALLPSSIDTNRPYAAALELAIEQHFIRREGEVKSTP